MQKKGFVFVETIIVTCVLLTALMVIYTLYVGSINTESRYTRYDDPAKLYQAYYLSKYFQSFNFHELIQDINDNCTSYNQTTCPNNNVCIWSSSLRRCEKRARFVNIWNGPNTFFGNTFEKERTFLNSLWTSLNIKNVYIIPSNVSNIIKCTGTTLNEFQPICNNSTLISYLKGIDDGPSNTYYMIFEFNMKKDGTACTTSSGCFAYYAYIMVGDS